MNTRGPEEHFRECPFLNGSGENCNGLVVGLPKTSGKFDSIWVIVDRLTKSAHFILVKVTYNAEKLAKIYISEIVRLQ